MNGLPAERSATPPTRLIRAAHAGDPAAMAALFGELRERLSRIVAIELVRPGAVGDADVEDLVQDSLLEAVRDFATFQPRSSGDLLRWLVTLARNNLRDKRRWQRVRRGLATLRTAMHSVLVDPRQRTAAETATENEQARAVDAAMLRLGDEDRRILLLRHYQLCSADEIARELGLPSAEAARARLARAKRRLQDELGPAEVD